MLSLLVGLSAAGCPSADTPQPTGSGLVVPDITGIDFPAAMQEALDVTFAADLRAAWAAHRQSLGLTRAGCPDFWVGDRDGEWRDHCTTGAGIAWSGELAWNDGLSIEGEEGSPLGVTTLGARLLDGAAQVDDEGAPLFGFSGTGDDSLYVSEAEGYVQWRYASRVEARVRGSAAYPATGATAGGLLLGLELAYSGGANSALTARGDVHLPGGLIAGRFDSVSLDVSLDGPGAALPDECAGEPRGWISLRDSDAVWYDLVLQPRFAADATVDPFPNEPYSLCEGCGTLYVRGVESGQVCVDFSALFDGRLQPPEPDGYVLPLRAQQGAP
jgi:hypothetical protein